MKWNWGTGIVLAFAGFMSFILYFIISVMVDKNYDYDLVTEDYYGEELSYQESINKLKNAENLNENLRYEHTADGLVIYFPETMKPEAIGGEILLYRPSNKHLDFKTPIVLSGHSLLIPEDKLVSGRWDLSVDWHYENTNYLYKQNLIY
ncbi:FixH family protein [Gaetbulibacter aestuarii]|uniref:FixH family protein n=1 Tax=Gaetbulibacter aestuarii TaxID=1502358 RepID=A0ABW7MYI8_9FLAO